MQNELGGGGGLAHTIGHTIAVEFLQVLLVDIIAYYEFSRRFDSMRPTGQQSGEVYVLDRGGVCNDGSLNTTSDLSRSNFWTNLAVLVGVGF